MGLTQEHNTQERGGMGSVVECDICMHKWIAVFHSSCERLECPNCGNMAHYEIIGFNYV